MRSGSEVPAPMLRRVASTGLDTLLCSVLLLTPFWQVYSLDGSWWPPLILLLGVLATVLITVLRARSGRSLFSGLFGLRTISGDPGHAPGLRAMLRRHLMSAAAFLAAGSSVWSAFRDPTGRRRTWQDIAADTRVIDTRWGADPLAKVPAPHPETDTGEVAGLVVVDTPRRRRTRPGVLPNGLDMTPGVDAESQTPPQQGPVAVIDAAERAAGETSPESVPVVVVEAAPERIAARLVDDTGRSISLARSALVGRDPATAAGEEVEHLFAIDDPDRTVSKTHLRIDVSDRGVTVADRGSSNGTSARIGGVDHPLEAGVALGVPFGTILHLGGRTLMVEEP
ncbi:MAG: RDD family protein [Dietzia sp.]